MPTTLVIQSHTQPLPFPWIAACLRSVRQWAEANGFHYQFLGDELFELLPEDVLVRTLNQTVVATDVARLIALQNGLAQGYDTVIWCDADFLIFDPGALELPHTSFGIGREVWVQTQSSGKMRAHVKVHNAFMFYRQDNAFLDFYADTAMRLVRAHQGTFAPQFVGPKLLTALHNVVSCPVVETAGMLCPLVVKDMLAGSGAALSLFEARGVKDLAAANLCASSSLKGEVEEPDMERIIPLLLTGDHP